MPHGTNEDHGHTSNDAANPAQDATVLHHDLHSAGILDNADAPESVRATVGGFEEEFLLQKVLGIEKTKLSSGKKIAEEISERISHVIKGTRYSMDAEVLKEILREKIDRAIGESTPANMKPRLKNLNENEKWEVIAKAIYASIPQDILEQLLYTKPSAMDQVTDSEQQYSIDYSKFWKADTYPENKEAVVEALSKPNTKWSDIGVSGSTDAFAEGNTASNKALLKKIVEETFTNLQAWNQKRILKPKIESGSQNAFSSAFATKILVEDTTGIWKKVQSDANAEKLKEEKNKLSAQKELREALAELKALSPRFEFIEESFRENDDYKYGFEKKTDVGNVGNFINFANLVNERKRLQHDLFLIGEEGKVWTSRFGSTLPKITDTIPPPNATRDQQQYARDRGNSAQQRINDRIAAIDRDIQRYQKTDVLLHKIKEQVKKIDGESQELDKFLKNEELNPAFSASDVHDKIVSELGDALKSEDDVKKQLEELKTKEADAKAGGKKGDALQRSIFKEYFINKGVSAGEAEKCANYLWSKSLLDREMQGQVSELQEDLLGDEEEHEKAKNGDNAILNRIAKNCRIPVSFDRKSFRRTRYNILWSGASYPKLVTAYFAMKKVVEGKGPSYINLPDSALLKREMTKVSTLLMEGNQQLLTNDYLASLNAEDRATMGNPKQISVMYLKKFLEGDAPGAYAAAVDRVLGNTDRSTNARRRAVWNTLRGVTYGNKNASMLGAAKGIGSAFSYMGGKTKEAAKYLDSHGGSIALAGLSVWAAGPLGLGAWYVGRKAFGGSKT